MRSSWAAIPLGISLLLLPANYLVFDQAQRVSLGERDFLDRHWRRPLPPQGAPPERFSPLALSLTSQSCGTCHPAQFADWKTTLHSKSMGPGVAGQLAQMVKTDPEAVRSCLNCHAPLAEQASHILRGKAMAPNPAFDASLQTEGLVCAGWLPRSRASVLRPAASGRVEGDEAVMTLTIASVSVGHHFPTYVTPPVVVHGELVDRAGRPVPGSAEERMIGRQVVLDLSRQIADTRIPAGGRARFVFRRRLDRAGLRFRGTITVRPDESYAGFFQCCSPSGRAPARPSFGRRSESRAAPPSSSSSATCHSPESERNRP